MNTPSDGGTWVIITAITIVAIIILFWGNDHSPAAQTTNNPGGLFLQIVGIIVAALLATLILSLVVPMR